MVLTILIFVVIQLFGLAVVEWFLERLKVSFFEHIRLTMRRV